MRRLSLQADGRYYDGSEPTFVVGTNFAVPAEASTSALAAELRTMVALGLNAVRVRSRTDCERVAEAAVEGIGIVCEADEFGPPAATHVRFMANPGEQPLGFDGLGDPFFHTFLPAKVRCTRRSGPVVVSAVGCGSVLRADREDAWLRASLPAARAAGTAGIFWTAWRGPDGLLDANGALHAGRHAFAEFSRASAATAVDAASAAPAVGIWWPGGSCDNVAFARLVLAQYFLGLLGRPWVPIGRDELKQARCRTLLIAGEPVSPDDVAGLHSWIVGGGELCWHGPDLLGAAAESLGPLLGARPADWRSGRGISVNAFGERFTLAHFPRDVRAELDPVGANVLATDHQGLPVLLENHVGHGRVRYVLPVVEDAILPVAAHPSARDRWISWYRGMLGDASR